MMDVGSDVMDIDTAMTKEMCWEVKKFGVCAGIEVTVSHNPTNYNDMEIVKTDFQHISLFSIN